MSIYVVNHKVENFNEWKRVYDGFAPVREKFNVTEHYVLQSVADQDHVMVVGEGALDDIQKFLNSDDLKSGMANAGLSGAPEVFIGENQS